MFLKLQEQTNDTWVGYIEDTRVGKEDDLGALYYVIAVILIYGLSIVMMIASHIRKNKQDCQLRVYLKEMAILRKADRREKILGRISSLTNAAPVKCTVQSDTKEEEILTRTWSKSEYKSGLRPGSLKTHETTALLDDSRKASLQKKGGDGDDKGMKTDEETVDSVFLPVEFCLEMNRLTPSVTPMTTPSPSPPPRSNLKSKGRISFLDDGEFL